MRTGAHQFDGLLMRINFLQPVITGHKEQTSDIVFL